jgi:segregation and condensation protein B
MQGRNSTDRSTHLGSDRQDTDLDLEAQSASFDASEFVSLEELGSVYAKVLQGESPIGNSSQNRELEKGILEFHGTISIHGETDGIPVSIGSIIEAILFVGTRDGNSVSIEQLSAMMKEFPHEEIVQGIEQLQHILEVQDSSVRISKDETGYRLILTQEVESQIEQLKWGVPREAVLSQAAIDCLSLLAYQPGIARQDLEDQLGPGTGAILATLQRRGLIAVESEGFRTTERFLQIAGIESLDDLPKVDDF